MGPTVEQDPKEAQEEQELEAEQKRKKRQLQLQQIMAARRRSGTQPIQPAAKQTLG